MTTTVSQAVANRDRDTGPVTVMFRSKAQFAAVLPASVDVEAFLGTMAGALYASPDLMAAAQASPDSLYTALIRCASLGHQPGTDEFYLTPRKVKGKPTVAGVEGYRGIVERMYRSGAVASVVVREVCERDTFDYVEGTDDKPRHAVDWFGQSRGEMIGVYAYAVLTTGAVSRVVILSRDDVLAARDASDSKNSDYSPWNRADGGKNHPEFTGRSMWWKTAARRLEPWVPTSAEYRREQLRAAAAASDLAAARDPATLADGGSYTARYRAAETTAQDIHDADIVDDGDPAPAVRQASRPSQAALGKLTGLLQQIPLGEEPDVLAFLSWQTGTPVTSAAGLSKGEVQLVVTFLDDALHAAEGDGAEAASRIWQQYQQAGEASGTAL